MREKAQETFSKISQHINIAQDDTIIFKKTKRSEAKLQF